LQRNPDEKALNPTFLQEGGGSARDFKQQFFIHQTKKQQWKKK